MDRPINARITPVAVVVVTVAVVVVSISIVSRPGCFRFPELGYYIYIMRY